MLSRRGHSAPSAGLCVAILLALPWFLFALNRNWPFQGFGDYDSFYYFGHFIHFPHYQKLRPTYAGERLPWLLPGYALVHLFGSVYGTLILHFLFYYVSTFSLFFIVSRFCGLETALFAAAAMEVHPYFLSANATDYVTGACLGYSFLAFALLVGSSGTKPSLRWLCLFLAGVSWAAVIYTYPFWLTFTPACAAVYLAARVADRLPRPVDQNRDEILPASLFVAGVLALTAILMLVHYRIFGAGGLDFQRNTIETSRVIAHMTENPWIFGKFSVTFADWLVFPALTALLALALLLLSRLRRADLPAGAPYLLIAHVYCTAVMTLMTLRPTRSLEFDYAATFLLPGSFLVLGVSFFHFAQERKKPLWIALALSCAISVAPLIKPGLYVKPHILGAIAPGMLLSTAFALRFLRPRSVSAIGAALLALGAASFCLAPAVGGIAWRDPSDWFGATGRVAQSVRVIESRLAYDQYPAFWYQENQPNGLEFQAIMCAFLSHVISMRDFPNIDLPQQYAHGQMLLLLSHSGDVFDPASSAAQSRGMRLSFLWKERISGTGAAYWIIATRIR